LIVKPDSEYGYQAHTEFIDDVSFRSATVEHLKVALDSSSYDHSYFFVVDSICVASSERPILCVSRDHQDTTDRFRVIPREMWIIENNLSTANLLFHEFLYSVDETGTHRED